MSEDVTADQGAADPDGDRAKRGAGFPTMDLASAVEVIHRVGGHGADFSLSAFAQYCGHQTPNSGPFKMKLAAFRDWSLVKKNKEGRVFLTDLGLDVARSSKPLADLDLLRRVFDACSIFKTFHDDKARGIPIKVEMLGRTATLDLGVAAKSQDRFVKVFTDSAVTAGLAHVDGAAKSVTFNAGPPVGAPTEETPEPEGAPAAAPVVAAPADPAAPATAAPAAAAPGAPVLLRQVWPTAAGEVVFAIHSTDPLPATAFALVGDVVTAAEALAKSLGDPDPAADDAP
jgi:hypothetical protein